MPSLHDMQRGFAAALIGANPARVPTIRADGLSPAQRLGFYRTNVLANYIKALRLTYPVIEHLVGPAPFVELAKHYVARYPSCEGALTGYGDQFCEFLAHHPIARTLPYLPDVARLEWAMEEVFNEADHPGMSQDQLSALPLDRCEQVRFALHPASRLLSSNYPLRRIWLLGRKGDSHSESVSLDEGGERLLIWRDGMDPTMESLGTGEYAMLLALGSGQDFGTAYGYAREASECFDPAEFLCKFAVKRILTGYTLPADAVY